MRILVFTPYHVFRSEQEKTLAQLRADFKNLNGNRISFVSARQDIGITDWAGLEEVNAFEGPKWDMILVPLSLSQQRTAFEQDLAALKKFAKRFDRKNIIVHFLPGTNGRLGETKLALMQAGISFFHVTEDGNALLYSQLHAARSLTTPIVPVAAATSPAKVADKPLDLEYFRIARYPGGNGKIAGTDVELDATEIAILEYLKLHAGTYMTAMDIGKALFGENVKSGISTGKILQKTLDKLGQVNASYKNCIVSKPGATKRVAFLPKGMTAATLDKIILYRDIEIIDMGWFKLELSRQFHPRRTVPAARIEGTSIIINPTELKALQFADKKHGDWIRTYDLKGDDVPSGLRGYFFQRHMDKVYKKLTAAGHKPDRFIKFHETRHMRYLRANTAYPDVLPLSIPRRIAQEVKETIDMGGWFNLEVRANDVGIIVPTGAAIHASLTKVFKYALENKDTLLNSKQGEKLFAHTTAPLVHFNRAMVALRTALIENGYPNILVHIERRGTFFCTRGQAESLGKGLYAHFSEKARAIPRRAPPTPPDAQPAGTAPAPKI